LKRAASRGETSYLENQRMFSGPKWIPFEENFLYLLVLGPIRDETGGHPVACFTQ